MRLHRHSDRKKESIRIALLLCGLWFCYLALKDESLFNLLFSTEEMVKNRVMVTVATTISTAVPTFFAVAMFKESFLVKTQAIYYYQRLIDTKSFWILAGLVAFLFGGISLKEFMLIPVANFAVGIYLIIFGIKPSLGKGVSAIPATAEAYPKMGPRIILEDQVFGLSKNFTTIGRGKKADIQIPDPREVINPVHAGILKDERGYWVIDNDSVNGTFIFSSGEFKRITKWALYNRDVIAFCYTREKGPYATLQFRTD
ncbi:MAG: FHA domain-containing protein [Candidatus Methanofastidiosia archaeon]